jgi:hypothetical protein
MYIVQKLDEIFCGHQLGPFDLWCDLVLEFLYQFFGLDDLSIGHRVVLNSPTTTVLESICVFRSFRVCLMNSGALTLGAYRLIIVISFCCIYPFISMECPSLSHLINVVLSLLCPREVLLPLTVFCGHWLGNSSSSLSLSASAYFC